MPTMTLAAKNCFYTSALRHLKTLVKELDVVATTPDLIGHFDILINTVLPHLSPAEVNAILEMRCEVKEDPVGDVLNDMAVQEALFPEEDQKVLQDTFNYECCVCELSFHQGFKLLM